MVKYVVWLLVENGMEEEKAMAIAQELATGKYTHDFPLGIDKLRELGLNVSTEVPEEVYQLMSFTPSLWVLRYLLFSIYPCPTERKRSYNFIPWQR